MSSERSIGAMSVNGMVRPCSCPPAITEPARRVKTRSTPWLRQLPAIVAKIQAETTIARVDADKKIAEQVDPHTDGDRVRFADALREIRTNELELLAFEHCRLP